MTQVPPPWKNHGFGIHQPCLVEPDLMGHPKSWPWKHPHKHGMISGRISKQDQMLGPGVESFMRLWLVDSCVFVKTWKSSISAWKLVPSEIWCSQILDRWWVWTLDPGWFLIQRGCGEVSGVSTLNIWCWWGYLRAIDLRVDFEAHRIHPSWRVLDGFWKRPGHRDAWSTLKTGGSAGRLLVAGIIHAADGSPHRRSCHLLTWECI